MQRGYGSEIKKHTPPGGIADIGMTGRETAIEEAAEEAGLVTSPIHELTTAPGYNQTAALFRS